MSPSAIPQWPGLSNGLRGDIRIDAALDLQGAIQLRTLLLGHLDALPGNQNVTVDLSADAATAPAIQIVAALRASLLARGQFAGYGPIAARILGHAAQPEGR